MKLFWKTGNYPLKQAFTLLECLISLMIFSLVLHGLLTAVDYYKTSDQRMRQNRQNDLHHFELLFEEELKHYQVVQVHDQRLVLANPEKNFQRSQIILHHQKIYQTPGHQPYLYQVNAWQLIPLNEEQLLINLQLVSGESYTCIFKIQPFEETL